MSKTNLPVIISIFCTAYRSMPPLHLPCSFSTWTSFSYQLFFLPAAFDISRAAVLYLQVSASWAVSAEQELQGIDSLNTALPYRLGARTNIFCWLLSVLRTTCARADCLRSSGFSLGKNISVPRAPAMNINRPHYKTTASWRVHLLGS